MDRCWYAPAEADEGAGVAAGHGDDVGLAEQPAEAGLFADALAGYGDDAHGGGLGVDHADSHFVGDDAGNGGGGRVAGDGDHVEASGAAGYGFELFEGQRAGTGGRPNAGTLGSRTVNIQPFSPAFPLAESPVKAFFLVIPLKFQGKSTSHFL